MLMFSLMVTNYVSVRLSKSRALIGNNTVYTNESAITATLNRPNNSKVMFSVS